MSKTFRVSFHIRKHYQILIPAVSDVAALDAVFQHISSDSYLADALPSCRVVSIFTDTDDVAEVPASPSQTTPQGEST